MTRLSRRHLPLVLITAARRSQARHSIPVLIVDGINNHDWRSLTRSLTTILESGGHFSVDVSTTPPAGALSADWDAWRPDFSRYKAVVSNFNGGHLAAGIRWPRRVEQALETFVRDGGGLVAVHAANNSFLQWEAYNEMIGLGWREPSYGPSLVVNEHDEVVRIPVGHGQKPGHGPAHDFQMTVIDRTHPITRGIPRHWMHPNEQLTHGQHGPAKNLTVLSCAYSKDTRQKEVMEWVVAYGKGRVYTTMLGHTWKDHDDTNVRCTGFQTMIQRGTEWAATGAVTIPVPPDFPPAGEVRLSQG